ncbi:MAG TPA: agmatine deiminase family protein [Flavobacteriales bacterium]|nr:agmatine deiminase family protein [Flavobacteriales bacterium]
MKNFNPTLFIFLFLFSFQVKAQTISNTPPAGTIRTAAEWEEIQALVVTWTDYKSVLAEIIRYAQEECKVIVHCTNANTAQNELVSTYGVPVGPNVIFKVQPYNTLWIRDYGANTAYINDVDSLFLVDWKYNRPSRTKDDTIPRGYARLLNINLVQTTTSPNQVIHTGGNFMSDGLGTAFSSELVLDENPTQSETAINSIMLNYMGIDRYIKMVTLPYDGIHHIDMHMKLLDEETLLIGQYPTGISDGPQIEANLLYVIDNFNSVFETPYKIIRIVQPPDDLNKYPSQNGDYRTYSNAVFVNKTVLLPIYEEKYDTTALRIWRESLPGFRVIGIDCNSIIPASGAIHCITHSVGVNDPMLIVHQPLHDTYDTANDYLVSASLQHRSGINQAKLFYTIDTTQAYSEVPMTLFNSATNQWTATIPAQAAGTEVFYFIQGIAESGKTQFRPISAPEGYWSFNVLDSGSVITFQQEIMDKLFEVEAYPNPSKGITCIPVRSDVAMNVDLSVLDVSGRMVEQIAISKISSGESRFYINTTNWSAGMYFIRAQTPYGSRMQKLMVR